MPRRAMCITLISAISFSACAPPKVLRDLLSSRSGTNAESVEFPAPRTPGKPSVFQLGIITTTNSAGWSALITRGQETGGALVLATVPGGEAARLGIKAGDLIVAIDKTDIHNHEQVP